jgi:hypothetical protein
VDNTLIDAVVAVNMSSSSCSVAQTVYRRMIAWIMNSELERAWKEAVVA